MTMKPKKLLVSITGRQKKDWQNKLAEIKSHTITEAALFMEIFSPRERNGLQSALLNSPLKKIPLAHLRQDTTKDEIRFLKNKFGCQYFTIHEDHFSKAIKQWKGHYQNLYLELNTDNQLARYVRVEQIGGFCIDLAHFMKEQTKQTKEYRYIIEKLGSVTTACNHISGYSYHRNKDLHTVTSIRDFDYLYKLPHNLFGNVMAIEVFNSIKEQLRYRSLLKKALTSKMNFRIIN